MKGRTLLTRTPAGGGGERRVAVQVNASCEGGDGVTKKGGVVKTGEGVSWLLVMQSQVWDKVGVCFRDSERQVWCKSCV